MTKPSKLYEQLLANPGTIISFRDFERLLEAFGWQHKRTKGSHRTYAHPKVPAVLTINPMARPRTATRSASCLNSLNSTAYI